MKSFFKSVFVTVALVSACLLASLAVVPPAQAGALSDYLENKLIDHVFRGLQARP